MNYEDIILLVKAGFTRDQIAAMQIPKQEPSASPAPPEPPTQQEPPAPPAQQEPPAPAGMAELTQLMVSEFSKLNAAITASNLAQAQQPKQESVDDIIASIINPPQKNASAEFKIKEVK